MAITGFIGSRNALFRPESEEAAVARDNQHGVARAHGRADHRRAVGGAGARASCRRRGRGSAPGPRRRRKITVRPTTSGPLTAHGRAALVGPGHVAVAGAPGGDAVAGISADHQLGVATDGLHAADVRWPQQRRQLRHSRSPRRPGTSAAQTTSPTRSAGPIRSARRSTSLVPRGLATATSQRTVPRSGSRPVRRWPWPTSSVSLNAATTPGCDSVRGSPGRCSVQSRRPSSASNACTTRSTPITKTRSPATSGGVETREASA